MKRQLKQLPIVKEVKTIDPKNWNSYYGMNVSSRIDLEPIDQLDGFFVAKFLQNKTQSSFYPFVAGVYEILNSQSEKEARGLAKRKEVADKRKKQLLENIISNLGLNGQVYTTNDLWNREDYWEFFSYIIEKLDRNDIESRTSRKGMKMDKYPKEVLGKMEVVVPAELIEGWNSANLYIPIEIAEALWFKENLNVSFKIGPMESESIYDDFIFDLGIGIIGLSQPEYREKAKIDKNGNFIPSQIRKTVPYIGRKDQNRIFFSDTSIDIAMFRMPWNNPSFERALSIAEIYEDLMGDRKNGYADVLKVYQLVKLGRRNI